jgi:predicted amidohydrolase YtcJ
MQPNLILYNGVFRTQDSSPADDFYPRGDGVSRTGEARSLPTALAVANGRILALGDDDEVRALAGPQTRLYDMRGRLGLPGFMDSHFHFYDWSLFSDLSKVRSFAGLEQTLAEAAADRTPDAWILGQGFNETDWPDGRMPCRGDLDRAVPGRPVIIWRCDLHLAVASSRALELAGVDANTPDPTGGVIARDERGAPTGVLRENAINLVRDAVPAPTDQELATAMLAAQARLHALGITALHDVRLFNEAAAPRTVRTLEQLNAERRLKLRTWTSLPGELLDAAVGMGLRTGFGNSVLRLGHVKFFTDGGMGARTAYLTGSYLDAGRGLLQMPPEEIARKLQQADAAGLAVMLHAVGDGAVRHVIEAFEALEHWRGSPEAAYLPQPRQMHRVDHAQMIRPEDLARLGKLNVAVGMQPSNMVLDFNLIDRCLGPEGRHTYVFRSMLDSGVLTLFNSDCPVSDPNPLRGIHALVTRQRPDNTPEGGWHPEERISVAEAVRGYTRSPALAYGCGNELGVLAPGLRADLCVLDRDIYTTPSSEIADAQVDLTVFAGEPVFERPGS